MAVREKGGKEEKLQGPFFQPSRVPPPYSFPLPVLHSRGGLRTDGKQKRGAGFDERKETCGFYVL